jgi:hypothetical protein
LNGNHIQEGEYSIFTIPGKEEWTIILNKETEMHGTAGYDEAEDLIRFKVASDKTGRFYENFTIEFDEVVKDKANLYFAWENTQVKLPITTDSDAVIMAEIHERINIKKEDRPSLYFQSSMYYFNNNKDLKQALEWIRFANKNSEDFMYIQLQAKIEAALGEHKSAIKTLKASSDLAKKKEILKVVQENEALLAEWNVKSKKNK